MELNQLSHKVIGLAIEVHKNLGPGLLESAYSECLKYEIINSGLAVEREKKLPITYKDIVIDHGYRIDLLVEDLTDVHHAQILTYLKLGNYPLGLLINFNSKILKNGLKRFINQPFEISHPTDG